MVRGREVRGSSAMAGAAAVCGWFMATTVGCGEVVGRVRRGGDADVGDRSGGEDSCRYTVFMRRFI